MRGFSLIEMLIAVAIFSIGLGGLALMMLTAVRGTVEARNQSAAAMHASDLAELILMNPSYLGHYLIPAGPPAACAVGAGCTDAAWALDGLARWNAELESNLSGAQGLVCRDATPVDGQLDAAACDGIGMAVVKVFWREPHQADDAVAGHRRVVLPVLD
jgi:type IV pilus assembly protein PilV